MTGKRHANISNSKLVIVLLLIVIVLAGGQYYLISTKQPSAGAEITAGPSLEVDYKITAGQYDLPVTIVAIPGAPSPQDLDIFVYYGSENDFEAYGSTTPSSIVTAGLEQILTWELRQRGLKGQVTLVSDDDLSKILAGKDYGIIVFPAIAWNWELVHPEIEQQTLLNWIENGGTIFVLGGTIYYTELLTLVQDIPGVTTNPDSWSPGDSNNSGLAKLSPLDSLGNGFQWGYDDIAATGNTAAWIACTSLASSNLDTSKSLQLRIRVDGMSAVQLLYLQILDKSGNFYQYYISQMANNLDNWQNITIDLAQPSRQSKTPPDFTNLESLSLIADFKTGLSPGQYFKLYCSSMVQLISLIPEPIIGTTTINATTISEALGLDYDNATTGPLVGTIEALGGEVLGGITGGETPRTSIGAFDMGGGHIVIFGGNIEPPYGQELVAKDIIQILQSGILETPFVPVYRQYLLKGGASIEDTLIIPHEETSEPTNVLFFSTDMYHFFYRQYYFNN